jgi:hypothetical protein
MTSGPRCHQQHFEHEEARALASSHDHLVAPEPSKPTVPAFIRSVPPIALASFSARAGAPRSRHGERA